MFALRKLIADRQGTYPSVTEVHTACTAPGVDARGRIRKAGMLVACHRGRVAIEVGSALGMVSFYLAQRGMRVVALDPVLPNVQVCAAHSRAKG